VGVVVPLRAVDGGVHSDSKGVHQPLREPLDQPVFSFWRQAMGYGDFDFTGNLGILPCCMNLNLVPQDATVSQFGRGVLWQEHRQGMDMPFLGEIPRQAGALIGDFGSGSIRGGGGG
jgi:hypothetical protein